MHQGFKKGKRPYYNGHGYKRRHRHMQRNLMAITELKPGEKGIITSIKGNRRVVQRLADLGLTPKTAIHILKTAPLNGPIEVTVRGSKLAIGREIAKRILVYLKRS